jgi:regulator of sigma E protease
MSEIFGSIWWLIVALGVLVTFHELGHYWAARRCGVKVLRFSVGFGKPLWMRRDRHGTEWAIAMIPLGGFVRMLGEHDLVDRKTPVSEAERAQSHDEKPVGQRMLISVAGPLANFVLCIALLWLMFVIGRPDYAPVVGQVGGVAASAGLQRGDTLLAVGDRETPTWTEASMALLTAAIDRGQTPIRVRTAAGHEQVRRVDFSRIPETKDLGRTLGLIGIAPRHMLTPPVVGEVSKGSASEGVLRPGDRIVAIGGRPVEFWGDLAPQVARIGQAGGGEVTFERDGVRRTARIVPRQGRQPGAASDAEPSWLLGIAQPATAEKAPKDAVLRYGPIEAVPAALHETWYQVGELYGMLKRAFSGRLAVENTVSGPIGIARAANAYASNGVAWYLGLLALLSLSLGILNLLPIPVLDGGHLLYYLIELLKGSPLSERAMAAGQYVGLALLLGLMGLAFYNDLQGLIR